MQSRPFPVNQFPSKNQEVSITLKDGRIFAICSKGQYKFLMDAARQRLVGEAMEEGKVSRDGQIDEEKISEKLNHWCEHVSRFAPLNWVLERMSPTERESWKAQYRFGGVIRKAR